MSGTGSGLSNCGQSLVASRITAMGSIRAEETSMTMRPSKGCNQASQMAQQNLSIAGAIDTPSENLTGQLQSLNQKVIELETALEASERRFGKDYVPLPFEIAGAVTEGEIPLHGYEHLRRALAEAETRATWLGGELKMMSACSARRIGELEEAVAAWRMRTSGGTEQSTSDDEASQPERIVDTDKMDETNQVLQGLRKQFFRVLRERNELKAKCDKLCEELDARTWHRDRLAHELGKLKTRGRNDGSRSRTADRSGDDASMGLSVDTAPVTPSTQSEAVAAIALAATTKEEGLSTWRWPTQLDDEAPAWGKD